MNNQTELSESRIQLVESLSKSDITTCFGRAVAQAVRGDRFVIVKAGPSEEETAHELSIMRALPPHPCLSNGGRILLELEYVGGGTLESYLSRHGHLSEGGQRKLLNGPVPNVARFMLFWQMTSAVEACHAATVHHGNITLQNFLMSGAGCPGLKLTDFEEAVQSKQTSVRKGIPGTAGYRAPELLAAAITKNGKYDAAAADVWGLGVCLYVMCTGMAPFPPTAALNDMQPALASVHAMMRQSEERAARHNCPIWRSVYNLLQQMLCVDPKKRITIEGIKEHEYWRHGCFWLGLPIAGCHTEDEEVFTSQQKRHFLASLKPKDDKCSSESEATGGGVPSDSSSATTSDSMLSSLSSDASTALTQNFSKDFMESSNCDHVVQKISLPNVVMPNMQGNVEGIIPRKLSSPFVRSFSPPARLSHYPCAAYGGPHDRSAGVGLWEKIRRLGAGRF